NGGVLLRGYGTASWAIVTAALAGRPLGMLLAARLATLAGLHLPDGLTWRELIVVAAATSVGFTLALFAATAVFPVGPLLTETKIGALLTAAGVLLTIALARLLHIGRFARDSRVGSARPARAGQSPS